MADVRIDHKDLERPSMPASFAAQGDERQRCGLRSADVLAWANVRGVDGHGRGSGFPAILDYIDNGELDPRAPAAGERRSARPAFTVDAARSGRPRSP